jgi:hypothetical protein
MKYYYLIILLAIATTFLSCDNDTTNVSKPLYSFTFPLSGGYKYFGYDSVGTLVVQDTIHYYFSDSVKIRGDWNLSSVGNPNSIGPQIGSDTLTGNYSTTQLNIELNPRFRDNNVSIHLSSRIDSQTYVGRWNWITFSGITNYGKSQVVLYAVY